MEDPSLVPAVRSAIRQRALQAMRQARSSVLIRGTWLFDAGSLPVGLDHMFVLRQGVQEWEFEDAGRVTGALAQWEPEVGPAITGVMIGSDQLDPDKPFDIILRARPQTVPWAEASRRVGKPVPILAGDIVLVEGVVEE